MAVVPSRTHAVSHRVAADRRRRERHGHPHGPHLTGRERTLLRNLLRFCRLGTTAGGDEEQRIVDRCPARVAHAEHEGALGGPPEPRAPRSAGELCVLHGERVHGLLRLEWGQRHRGCAVDRDRQREPAVVAAERRDLHDAGTRLGRDLHRQAGPEHPTGIGPDDGRRRQIAVARSVPSLLTADLHRDLGVGWPLAAGDEHARTRRRLRRGDRARRDRVGRLARRGCWRRCHGKGGDEHHGDEPPEDAPRRTIITDSQPSPVPAPPDGVGASRPVPRRARRRAARGATGSRAAQCFALADAEAESADTWAVRRSPTPAPPDHCRVMSTSAPGTRSGTVNCLKSFTVRPKTSVTQTCTFGLWRVLPVFARVNDDRVVATPDRREERLARIERDVRHVDARMQRTLHADVDTRTDRALHLDGDTVLLLGARRRGVERDDAGDVIAGLGVLGDVDVERDLHARQRRDVELGDRQLDPVTCVLVGLRGGVEQNPPPRTVLYASDTNSRRCSAAWVGL